MAPFLITLAVFFSALIFMIWLGWFILNITIDTSRSNRQEKTFQVGTWLAFGGCFLMLAIGFYLILIFAYPDYSLLDSFQLKGSL